MTMTQRFADSPLEVQRIPDVPDHLDRSDPSMAWITVGQLMVMFWLLYGFGALEEGPTTMLGASVALIGGLVVLAPRGTFSKLRISVPVILLAVWWVLSYRWTTSTGSWWVRTKGEFHEMVLPIIAASLLPVDRIIQTFRVTYYGVVVLTFAATAADPFNTMTHRDYMGREALPGWHGTFIHKNDMAFFLLIGLMTVLVYEPRRWLRWGSTAVTLTLILLGRSGTGVLAFSILMAVVAWLKAHRNQPSHMRHAFAGVSLFCGIALVGIAVPLAPVLLQLGGKDPTISGRTEIWASSWTALQEQPWTGFGPGGIWENQAAEPTKSIVDRIGFTVFHSHNGPLELAMRLGLVGLALGLWLTAAALRHGWWLQRARSNVGRWMIAILSLMFITWFSENTMTGEWLGLLAMLSILGRRAREEIMAKPKDPQPARPRVL